MDLLVKQAWHFPANSSGTSGGMAAIEVPYEMAYATVYVDCSTLTTTQSFFLQSAQESSGPWVVEASTTIAVNTSTRFGMHLTGPIGPWVRPFFGSEASGAYNVILLGVG